MKKTDTKDVRNTSFSDPILCENPHSGKFINLQPMFYAAFQFSEKGEVKLEDLKGKISYAIRFLSTNELREEQHLSGCVKEIIHDLYGIVDMFEEMEHI